MAALPGDVSAQTPPPPPPDPGVISSQTLNQQREALEVPELRQDDGPAVTGSRTQNDEALPESAVRFVLRGVEFDPSKFLSASELEEIARPFLGTEVTFGDLGKIAEGVNSLYDARGLVTARAVLLPQTIEGGQVRLSLIEGAIGQINIGGNGVLSRQDAIARSGLDAGEILDPRDLERRLSLINRTNPVQMRAALKPGEQFGLTDIQLAIIAPQANLFQLFGDNYGYDSVGQWQAGGYYRRTGLIGASDRLSVYASTGEGALSGTASYDAAVFGPTTRLGISYGRSRSEIVNGPFAAVGSVGKTQNLSLSYSQPIASSSTGLLLASLTAGISETRNFVSGTFLNKTTTRKTGAGLSYSHVAPGVSIHASVNTLLARAPLTAAVGKATFGVISGTLFAEKRLGPVLGIRAVGGWQAATVDGVPGDVLFQIGGASTVRGYQQGVLSGDGGFYVNAEIEASGPNGLSVFAFFDHGRVFTVRDQAKSLSALGTGLNLVALDHLSIRATAGFPMQRLPGGTGNAEFFVRATLQF